MKLITALLLILISCTCYSQDELNGFENLRKEITIDTVYYDSFWEREQRKVMINCFEANNIIIRIALAFLITTHVFVRSY